MRRLRAFLSLPARDKVALLEAWAWLCASKASLKAFGLTRTVALWPQTAAGGAPADLPRATRWIEVGSRYCPGGASCLVQSLALLGILRRRRIAAELRIGVGATKPALDAHAWVEIAGVPLNDTADVASRYPPFSQKLAGNKAA